MSGANYTLKTERIGDTQPPLLHTTSNPSHALTNLLCGQRYTFCIAAQDGYCRSSYTPPIEISTGRMCFYGNVCKSFTCCSRVMIIILNLSAPCQPTNLTAQVDCGTNKGNFSWSESSGADFYTVEVTGVHGHLVSCSSNDTSCAVKLHCGWSYSATLVASTQSCNSSKNTDITFDSGKIHVGM